MAGLSKIDIANAALAHVGVSRVIASLDDDSEEAAAADRFYDRARRKVLEQGVWQFAKRRVTLGLVAEDPNDNWGYSYRWPSGCLIPRRIVDTTKRFAQESTPIPFELGSDATGRLIFTDEAEAILEYIEDYQDPAHFSELFASCIEWTLASYIAMPLTERTATAQFCDSMANRYLTRATAAEANATTKDPEPDPSFITDRA